MCNALTQVPGTSWIAGSGRNRESRLFALAEYMFDVSAEKDGVYLSSGSDGVLLMFNSSARANRLKMLYYRLKLICNCIGFLRLPAVLRREQYIRAVRPVQRQYLYVWFFAVEEGKRGKGAAVELANTCFAESARLGLPVYAETTISRNKKVYERFGFDTYHTWAMNSLSFVTWFLKLSPVSKMQ